ncbi:MAG: hypothetical protein QOJ89_512 [bacterium]|jgi:hypothetical protein
MWPAFMVMSRGLRAGGRLGPPWFLKMLVRPQWLFESTTPIPHRPITATQPRPRGDADVALCARIIEAYRISRGYDDLSTIWSGKLARHYATLDAALLTGDPLAVEDQLRWMFRRPFLCGISTPVDYEDPAARRFWSLMTFDSLVSLAESVGAIGAENPEQGLAGRAFAEGIDHLPARIEAKLGISLDFPRVGAPYGVVVGDRLIVRETGRHLDAAVRLHGAAREHLGAPGEQGRRIVEVGAGFGGVAMWYIRLLGDRPGSYTIVDLPLMNAVQAYFLGGVYGGAAIVLNGETSARGRIRIVPPRILAAGDVGADVVYNQDSLPEMTESAARGYLDWMARSVSGIFVSCNHEAGTTASVAQVVVSELAEQVDGLQRISRAPSWTRRGYVEEIFRCRGSRAQP